MSKILLLVLIPLLMTACTSLTKDLVKDPEVKIMDVDVEKVGLKDVLINLKLNIKNPNAVAIKLSKINYALQFSGKKVTEGVFDKGFEVPANGASDVVVPLNFEYNALSGLLDGLMKKSLSKDYELNGSAQVGIFSIPFTKKGELKLK